MNNVEKFKQIKAFVFDVDGVLCNQHIFVFENGQIMRQLYQKDIVALKDHDHFHIRKRIADRRDGATN